MTQLADLSIAEIGRRLAAGDFTASNLLTDCLDRVNALNPHLNAFIHVAAEDAAREASVRDDQLRRHGPLSALHGIPIAIKDIIDVEGQPTTAHSAIGVTPRAIRDACVVSQLRAAGAVIVGKTALHEFATGGPSFDLPWPPARNPWMPSHHPGGSSSGSAVALASGMVPAAIGTDTAGSVRHPATASGIVGLKPTFGAVSVEGVFPLSPSLDHVGPMARTVHDCAIIFDAIRGQKLGCLSCPLELPAHLRGRAIGVIDQFGVEADPEIQSAFNAGLNVLKQLGATLAPVRGLPPLSDFTECGRLILQAESYAIHARWLEERPEDYGQRGRTKLLRGKSIDPAALTTAKRRQADLSQRFREAMRDFDAAVCVSSLHLPCAIDDEEAVDQTYDRQARTPFNVTGSPAVAVPVGFSRSGLPLGMQVVGGHQAEPTILAIAHAYEQAAGWYRMRPPLSSLLPVAH